MFNFISDLILGPCIRKIESSKKSIYLTFDDGPNAFCTPKVLDLLIKHNAKASFFVIGNKIEGNLLLMNRIQNEGHSIGNHSIDHDTNVHFKGKAALKKWIDHGEAIIQKHTDSPSIGFRPPVGIRTPVLKQIMKLHNEKPIMWQHRFFDTVLTFTEASWKRKIHKICSGDIIVLHDTHKKTDVFLSNLDKFIAQLIEYGFQLRAIPNINIIEN